MALLAELDVLPNGDAWFVGGCGLRFRATANGKVDDFRAPPVGKKFSIAGQVGSCTSTAAFWGVYARSPTEAYVVGDTRCGLDPNTIWYRPLETFDGKSWSTTRVAFGKGAHDGLPWELEGTEQMLYTLVEGDDWHGPPECGVFRFANGAWGKAELECPHPKKPDDRVMVLRDLEVDPSGNVWVAGHVALHGKPASGMLWLREHGKKQWNELPVDDVKLASVGVGADGSVFAGGKSLWQRRASAWERVSTDSDEIGSLWVQSAERVWLARGSRARVFSGGAEHDVEIVAPGEGIDRVHGAGEHVWAMSRSAAWKLDRDADSAKPVRVTIDSPTE
jgi:hypothetical protein